MKRNSEFMRFTSIIVLVTFFSAGLISCSSGGGDAAPAPATTLTSTDQAGEAANAAVTGSEFGQFLAGMTLGFGMSQLPAAPGIRSKSVNADKLAKLDPRLQKLAESMAKQLQVPALTAAVKKARALGASLAPVSETINCDSGTIVLSGTDSSTVTYDDFNITFTFNACRSDAFSTELSGSLRLYNKWMYDGSSDVLTLTATNFAEKTYTNSTYAALLYTYALNATFGYNDAGTTVGSGTFNANGRYTYTEANTGFVGTLLLNSINAAYAWTPTTDMSTVNGGFNVTEAIDGTTVFSLNVSFSNFKEEWELISGTEEHMKYNGRVIINYTPDDAGCFEGVFDITTPADKPLVLTSADGYICPVSGTLKVNNATIVFGSPITITVGTQAPVNYADCTALGGGVCGGSAGSTQPPAPI